MKTDRDIVGLNICDTIAFSSFNIYKKTTSVFATSVSPEDTIIVIIPIITT